MGVFSGVRGRFETRLTACDCSATPMRQFTTFWNVWSFREANLLSCLRPRAQAAIQPHAGTADETIGPGLADGQRSCGVATGDAPFYKLFLCDLPVGIIGGVDQKEQASGFIVVVANGAVLEQLCEPFKVQVAAAVGIASIKNGSNHAAPIHITLDGLPVWAGCHHVLWSWSVGHRVNLLGGLGINDCGWGQDARGGTPHRGRVPTNQPRRHGRNAVWADLFGVLWRFLTDHSQGSRARRFCFSPRRISCVITAHHQQSVSHTDHSRPKRRRGRHSAAPQRRAPGGRGLPAPETANTSRTPRSAHIHGHEPYHTSSCSAHGHASRRP